MQKYRGHFVKRGVTLRGKGHIRGGRDAVADFPSLNYTMVLQAHDYVCTQAVSGNVVVERFQNPGR